MNPTCIKFGCIFLMLIPSVLHAGWLKVFDFEDYDITQSEEALIAHQWIFQDYDLHGNPHCLTPSIGCSGLREIKYDPFTPHENKVISIRAAALHSTSTEHATSITAFNLPAEIPLDSIATLYFRVAAEDARLAMHFGLTSNDAPANRSPDTFHDYSDFSTTGQIAFESRSTLGIYYDTWQDATVNEEQVLEIGSWYELWYQIDHKSGTAGGGYFDVYIRGPNFTSENPDTQPILLSNPYVVQPHYGILDSPWPYRNSGDAPLRRFLNVANALSLLYPTNDSAILFDDMYLLPGEHSLDTPQECRTPDNFWISAPAIPGSDFKETGLGLVYDRHFPWIWSAEADSWLFIGCNSTPDSIYVYHASDAAWYWTFDGACGWHHKVGSTDYGEEGWAAW